MQKWEYKIIDSRHIKKKFVGAHAREKVEEYLNQLGDHGWEIIEVEFEGLSHDIGSFVGIAKRPKK